LPTAFSSFRQTVCIYTFADLDTDRRFKHTVLIRQQYVYFLKKIEPELSGLLAELYANSVLEQHEKEEIDSEATTTQKNEKLLSILCRKTYEKFEIFLQSLEKTGQGHLVAFIRGQSDFCPGKVTQRASGGSTLGPGGTGPPKCWPGPPQIFGQLNYFLETGNQEIIELSILSHIACYLT
jgi:hypothetical protein